MKLLFSICTRTRPHVQKRFLASPFISKCHFLQKSNLHTCLNPLTTSPCQLCTNKQRIDYFAHRHYAKDAALSQHMDCITDDMSGLHNEINQILHTRMKPLRDMCCYYFDGNGKQFRPMVVFLISRLCNQHCGLESTVSKEQRKLALIAEMIHVGSLIHDDVVDFSDVRRGKRSVNALCGDRNAVMAGNYVVANSSKLLATIGNSQVTIIISQIIDDIVRGEFMQQDNKDQFNHYLKKTYKKTASLIANCCKASACLSSNNQDVIEAAYQYGRNIGIAFQLIDDLLDFVSSSDAMGKPSAADLNLGLATAPVLFACDKYPDLHALILRRFGKPGDVAHALEAVHNSSALEETRLLAQQYCKDAIAHLSIFQDSPEKSALVELTDIVLNRSK
uniref:Uncharacterized protein n=1 Tax=Ciona savignyi TaxID=51511 RepID=H2Z168_CIOSA